MRAPKGHIAFLALLVALSALPACRNDSADTSDASPSESQAVAASAVASSFSPVADVQELMAQVVEPAADIYWDAVGWISDANGTTYIHPESPEEWEAVRNAALVVAESGNLLMMDGRAVDEGAWMGMSQSLVDVGRRAIDIAEARDEQGVFDVGAEIYEVCTNCHARYALETLRPNATGN